MAPNPTHPPRLHVLLARNAPLGLILRRGPAKHVATFLWDRKSDTFTLGQWLKGRIYERRGDLSPDGRHWIYFAMNGHWDGAAKGSWTAVAQAPWLKALALYPKGDCWQGGGLFLDDRRYWVNGGGCHDAPEGGPSLREDRDYAPPNWYGGECPTVYYNRLQRDGWNLLSQDSRLTVFQKSLPKNWTLEKHCHAEIHQEQGKGVYWDEHLLYNDDGEGVTGDHWEWADWVDGEVVYAEKGCLYRRALLSTAATGPSGLIHDFSGYTFEPREAPY